MQSYGFNAEPCVLADDMNDATNAFSPISDHQNHHAGHLLTASGACCNPLNRHLPALYATKAELQQGWLFLVNAILRI